MSDPLAGQLLTMPELQQLAGMQTLDTAADILEASPRGSFTREEVVRTLRALKECLFDFDCYLAYEMALTSAPLPLNTSNPS
jgi:hypothetical protein